MKELPVINPRTGAIDYHAPDFEPPEIAACAATLRSEQTAWQSAGIAHRCQCLRQWREAIEQRRDAIAEALCEDTGRRVFAHFEVQKVIDLLQFWVDKAPAILAKQSARQSQMVPSVVFRHHLVPYPLVGVISPWNVPLILALIDTIPALLAGCAVLLKPSEVTPRFTAPLRDSLEQIEGLRPVLEIVTGGAATGAAVVDNADTICFTGSVATGRKVAVRAAQNFIPAILELGGKDPAIVMPSADLDNAATAILRSAAGLTGQACQSLERIYVHSSIFTEFRDILIDKAQQVELNWPDINHGTIGPLIFSNQADTIARHMQDAVSKGAQVHCGGEIEQHGGGRWCRPTVVTKVNHDMLLLTEETFGPIMPLLPFDSTEQAIAMANDSAFGLSASVFTADRREGEAIAERLNVGAIGINDASLTGIVNDVEKNSFCLSGMGHSRMGESALTRFLRKRALLYQTAPAPGVEIFSEGQLG